MSPPSRRATLKTYSHLAGDRRMPSDYDLVSSRLLYYVPRGGFEVDTPVSDWYERHQRGSALACNDWEAFRDPRATTYTTYTAHQKAREAFVDGIFASIESSDYDASLAPAWRATLARALFPLRYPWHGLQMAAAYVGQMAPSGRIAMTSLFQAADEVRRIQRVAYRMALFDRAHATSTSAAAKEQWMRDPAWQPLRETIERLLVTYDWGEAFVALDLCVKPALDGAVRTLARTARSAGDYLLAELLRSFEEDAEWHRAWAAVLVDTAIAARPQNRETIARWTETWTPRAHAAAAALAGAFESGGRAT